MKQIPLTLANKESCSLENMTRSKLGVEFSKRKKFGNPALSHQGQQPLQDRLSPLGPPRRLTKSDGKENVPCALGTGVYKFSHVASKCGDQQTISAAPAMTTHQQEPLHDDSNKHDDRASCWVLIYGFTTEAQYNDMLQLFSAFGQIVERRGLLTNGPFHWAVLRFKHPTHVLAALLHDQQGFMSSDGHWIVCGVRRLTNDDPILQYDELHLPKTESVCKRLFRWLFPGF